MDKENGCCGWVALSARLALAVWASLALTGCLSYRYIPQGDAGIADVTAPVELADFNYAYKESPKEAVTGMAITDYANLVDNASKAEFNNWFQGQGDDISVSFSTKTVRSKGGGR